MIVTYITLMCQSAHKHVPFNHVNVSTTISPLLTASLKSRGGISFPKTEGYNAERQKMVKANLSSIDEIESSEM